MKDKLKSLVIEAIKKVYSGVDVTALHFSVEAASNPLHGDFSTNIAMQTAKMLKINPREVAKAVTANIETDGLIDKIEVAGPGFINFFLNDSALHSWLKGLISGVEPLQSNMGKGKKIMVEFVSANPTGPLHIGHGRGAAVGDSISRILKAVGYNVHNEYYVNDGGNQMVTLSASIFARCNELSGGDYSFPQDGYKGDYIIDIAKDILLKHKDIVKMPLNKALEICKKYGIEVILKNINDTLKRFNVDIDEYFSEQSLYDNNSIEKCLKKLMKSGAIYKDPKDKLALWLKTESKGDEKDRVVKKSDGSYTYLMPDIAYHNNKYERGYDLLVDVWGADHHGYVKRMESAISYLGYDSKTFDVVLVQMVGLLKDGQKLLMSTRAGEFITLDWLIDEVSVDAARFFYNMRSSNSQFDFDMDLAKSKNSDNPVYYVQYAHARVCSLFENAESRGIIYDEKGDLKYLTLSAERDLIKKLIDFKPMLELAATYMEPHRIAYYLQELAGSFHAYYYNTKILSETNKSLINARLTLCKAIAQTIKYGLSLLGVSAPERM